MRKTGKTIRRHIDNIVTYNHHSVINATSGRLNSQILKIRSLACGFRNTEHPMKAIYFHRGGLDLYPY